MLRGGDVAISTRYVWNGCRRSDTPAFVKDKLKQEGRVVQTSTTRNALGSCEECDRCGVVCDYEEMDQDGDMYVCMDCAKNL